MKIKAQKLRNMLVKQRRELMKLGYEVNDMDFLGCSYPYLLEKISALEQELKEWKRYLKLWEVGQRKV